MLFKLVDQDTIYQGKVLELTQVLLEFPTGKQSRYELVKHNPSVSILAVDAEGSVLMVRQYRLGVQGDLLEFPAGVIEEGEQPSACAQRELREEIGFAAGQLDHIGQAYLIPGYGNELMHFFLAKDLRPDPLAADEDEHLEVIRIPIARIYQMAENGEIQDSKSLAALSLARGKLMPPE